MPQYPYLILGVGALGAAAYALHRAAFNTIAAPDGIQDGGDDTTGDILSAVESAVVGWKSVGSADEWLDALAAVEEQYNLPTDLLARIAYQESHFREDIIRGLKLSSAGAVGMMQLEPMYYVSATAARPYTDATVRAQIDDAAKELVHLYTRFHDWRLAIAAYNAGEGTVHKYGGVPPFDETQTYVADVLADVPALQGLV